MHLSKARKYFGIIFPASTTNILLFRTLKKPLVLRLLSSVLHQESLVDLIDEEKLLINVLKVLDSSSTISTNVDDSSVLTQTVVDVVDLVTSMEPISVMSKILCSHRNKTGDFNQRVFN